MWLKKRFPSSIEERRTRGKRLNAGGDREEGEVFVY